MAQVTAPGSLCAAQTGTGDSTNTIYDPKDSFVDTGRPATIKMLTTVGATPTLTVNIQGSVDGTTFANIPYALSSAKGQYGTAAIVITTATTAFYLLQPGNWRFVKLVLSANTNVTLTADYT